GAWFETENLKVHLGVDKNFTPAKKAHIAFLTKNVGEIEKLCIENGYEVYSDQPLEGYTRIYVLDPFGNRLEFMEKLEI
ncbi:MAG TPA: glyoxalase, partial [Alphaproteobacteria bacterium]|nr:glyoxalase [Alphaproteobacteria bacterium]